MLVGYAGLGENDIVKQIKEKSREIGRLKAQQQLNPENAESLQERINKLTKEIYSKKPINEDGESSLMTQLKNQQDITQEDIKIVQEAAEAETDLAKATNIRIKTTKDATQVVHSDRESLNAAKKAHDEKTQSVKQDTEEEKKNTEAKKEKILNSLG